MRSNKPSPRWAPGLRPLGVNLDAHRVQALVITVNLPFCRASISGFRASIPFCWASMPFCRASISDLKSSFPDLSEPGFYKKYSVFLYKWQFRDAGAESNRERIAFGPLLITVLFLALKKIFPKKNYFFLPFFYATFQCGRYNVFKNFFFWPQKVEITSLKSCS